MATKTKLPKWLDDALVKYSTNNIKANREIFEVHFENNEEFDVDSFRGLCVRFVGLKHLKKGFINYLEAQGHFGEVEDSEEDEPEDEELEEDEAIDDGCELEEEELEEAEANDGLDAAAAPVVTKRKPGRPRTKPLPSYSQYEDTGIPTLEEVTALVGDDYDHTQEFDNPIHLNIAAQALGALGFMLEYDARVEGGTIKRPRGGKFVLNLSVSEKRAVKRRGKTAPVFAFVEQITTEFDVTSTNLINELVAEATTE